MGNVLLTETMFNGISPVQLKIYHYGIGIQLIHAFDASLLNSLPVFQRGVERLRLN